MKGSVSSSGRRLYWLSKIRLALVWCAAVALVSTQSQSTFRQVRPVIVVAAAGASSQTSPVAIDPPRRRDRLPTDPDEDQQSRSTLKQATSTTPDLAQRVLRMQLKTGLPTEVIRRNLEEVERKAGEPEFDAEAFRASYLPLRAWWAEQAQEARAEADLRSQSLSSLVRENPQLLILTLLVSFIITWGTGLTPPLLIRYAFVRHPLSKKNASWVAAGFSVFFWIAFRIFNSSLGERPGTGGVWLIIFLVARWIMSRGNVGVRASDHPGGLIAEALPTLSSATVETRPDSDVQPSAASATQDRRRHFHTITESDARLMRDGETIELDMDGRISARAAEVLMQKGVRIVRLEAKPGNVEVRPMPAMVRGDAPEVGEGGQGPGKMVRNIALSAGASLVAWVICGIAVEAMWPLIRDSSFSKTPGAGFAFLPALAIMIPILRAIWHRPTLQLTIYTSLVGAFICLWIASAEESEAPFEQGQWQLLGWTLLAVAAAIRWRQHTATHPR